MKLRATGYEMARPDYAEIRRALGFPTVRGTTIPSSAV